MAYCQKCGSQVQGTFCPNCGQGVQQQQQPAYSPPPPPVEKKSPIVAVIAVIIIGIVLIAIVGVIFMGDLFGSYENDISITVSDDGWDMFGLYYHVDVRMSNNGDNSVDIYHYAFDIRDSSGALYSVEDYEGNPPDSLAGGASASWSMWFDIPIDSNPVMLIYDDWGDITEVNL